ncbi:hypothetical protein MLD38_024849 [Melastoma candidum]|uniref:Uncharacterized protein n=1 Tax=Melastoma candidum TaxID=119954 RepID=A0ACB9NUI1_9MYRT|nr:hypothetical protein MLD38_024849 [Melastoma candidum]
MKGAKSRSKSTDAALAVNKSGRKSNKKEKKAKDPNKPKRPPSAFFVFLEEFRKEYKEKHPQNKAVSVVGKAAGDKWKSMSDEDKGPYVAKAGKRKADYEKNMKAYNKEQADGPKAGEDDAEKSMSEVNNEEDGEEGSDEEV